MTFSKLIFMCISITFITACSSAIGIGPRPGFGAVIVDELDNNSAEKNGVQAITDTGRHLFGSSSMRKGGRGTSSFIGESAPKTVRVSWRKPVPGYIIATTGVRVETMNFGEVLGDYTIEVASRIPAEVMKYASEGKERAIKLTFRIKDDGVLLAWGVQENYGGLNTESLRGGDFPCSPTSQFATRPTCTSGYLKDAPWYRP